MSSEFSLKGRIALVTGGSRGIGRAISLALADAGASVAVVGRDATELAVTYAELRQRGVAAAQVVGDVSTVSGVRAAVDQARAALGPIDILVTSAGISEFGPSEQVEEATWDRIMDTNLKGSFFCASYVARDMIARKSGRIIFVGSEEGLVGVPQHAAYCISKAGIVHMTKVLALEWGEYGIRVNCIAPAAVKTRINETYWLSDAKAFDWVVSRIALGRVSEASELGGAAVFLASDASSFVTGHTLVVDGGISVGLPRRKSTK